MFIKYLTGYYAGEIRDTKEEEARGMIANGRALRAFADPPPPPVQIAMSTCGKCGKTGSALDEFTSPYTGLCRACTKAKSKGKR